MRLDPDADPKTVLMRSACSTSQGLPEPPFTATIKQNKYDQHSAPARFRSLAELPHRPRPLGKPNRAWGQGQLLVGKIPARRSAHPAAKQAPSTSQTWTQNTLAKCTRCRSRARQGQVFPPRKMRGHPPACMANFDYLQIRARDHSSCAVGPSRTPLLTGKKRKASVEGLTAIPPKAGARRGISRPVRPVPGPKQ